MAESRWLLMAPAIRELKVRLPDAEVARYKASSPFRLAEVQLEAIIASETSLREGEERLQSDNTRPSVQYNLEDVSVVALVIFLDGFSRDNRNMSKST